MKERYMNYQRDITTKPVLRYPGGKTRAVKTLDTYIPDGIETVCAPFIGGGSFELHLTSKGIRVEGYDMFSQLVIFWEQMLNHPDVLADNLQEHLGKIDKETFKTMQKDLISFSGNNMKLARDFYIVNRCSFSGATLSGGYSASAATQRFTQSSIDRVRNFHNDLLTVHHGDALDVIPEAKEDILFLDPPYLLEDSTLYGVHGDKHKDFDHKMFFEIVKESGKPFLLTYNNHPDIKTLWKDYEQVETSWSYGMNASKKSSELIIHNGLV